jgi:hypothetical protein
MTNQPDFRKLLEAWSCGDAGAKQALADYMLEHAQELFVAVNALPEHLALREENERLKAALEMICDHYSGASGSFAADIARAALSGGKP